VADPKVFSLEFEQGATRDLAGLSPEIAGTILREIQRRLAADPYREIKTRIKRLTGFTPPIYRLRIGDYRAYYRIRERRVIVLAILHKKESDRWLKRLS
jgi:mRNA-degrading endonuclease RelE of RelBE toxin-antitoxin system